MVLLEASALGKLSTPATCLGLAGLPPQPLELLDRASALFSFSTSKSRKRWWPAWLIMTRIMRTRKLFMVGIHERQPPIERANGAHPNAVLARTVTHTYMFANSRGLMVLLAGHERGCCISCCCYCCCLSCCYCCCCCSCDCC